MVTNAELQQVGTSGWRTGLGNLLRKENHAWWATRRCVVQAVLWTVIVNGMTAAMVLLLGPMVGGDSRGLGVEFLSSSEAWPWLPAPSCWSTMRPSASANWV